MKNFPADISDQCLEYGTEDHKEVSPSWCECPQSLSNSQFMTVPGKHHFRPGPQELRHSSHRSNLNTDRQGICETLENSLVEGTLVSSEISHYWDPINTSQ
jgi:hypothetical protein